MNRQEQIERMIALCEAATRGPWRNDVFDGSIVNDEGHEVISPASIDSHDRRYIAAHDPDLVADLWRVVAAADSVRQHGDIESGRMMTDTLDALWQRLEGRGE